MASKLVDKVLGFIGFEEEPFEEEKNVEERFREEDLSSQPKRKGQVLNLHAQRQIRVVVVEPRSFEEVQSIADHLKNRRPVVINLEEASAELAKRVVDFMSGATYALNGSTQKVGTAIFLFVPSNMDIEGEIRSQIREYGTFNWLKE